MFQNTTHVGGNTAPAVLSAGSPSQLCETPGPSVSGGQASLSRTEGARPALSGAEGTHSRPCWAVTPTPQELRKHHFILIPFLLVRTRHSKTRNTAAAVLRPWGGVIWFPMAAVVTLVPPRLSQLSRLARGWTF